MKTKIICTQELIELRQQLDVKLIDIRSVDAYNGWTLCGESRSGHIPGAKSLPYKWTEYMDWIEIVRSKGLDNNDTIVIYGYTIEEMQRVASMFEKSGFINILIYDKFISEWNKLGGFHLERLPRYRHLVPARWVHDVLAGNKVTHPPLANVVIVHSHYRNRDAYLSGHIPGAIDMDTLALESSKTWNRRSPEELKAAFESHGISSDTTVIVYGKFMWPDNADDFPGSAAGHIGAIRNAMIMLYAGVKDVRIMNGGFQSWKDAGYEIDTNDVSKSIVADFGCCIPAHPEIIVDVPKVKEMIKADDADIVCVRSWSEYIGDVSGYNYIEAKGRIPGTVFADCGSDAYHMENYRNVDHTIREAQEVEAIWENNNIVSDKHLAFYCGTGWRGSEAFMNAWLMGWPRVSVFDGGWFQWSNENNDFETGLPDIDKVEACKTHEYVLD